ncbi:hypothetical protein MBLNU13_g01886t1 [Cladosporium sp. NU13]
MNRYGAGGPSKATSTTLCQKCLKRGHFSYECKASQQDRPYISRPSRTQQLANPKLAAKITNAAPKDEIPKTSASDIIKSSAAARGRKLRDQALTDPEARQEGIIDVRPHKRGLGDVSLNVNDHVQEALTATQASPTTELLHHRNEVLLHQCSVSGA